MPILGKQIDNMPNFASVKGGVDFSQTLCEFN